MMRHKIVRFYLLFLLIGIFFCGCDRTPQSEHNASIESSTEGTMLCSKRKMILMKR